MTFDEGERLRDCLLQAAALTRPRRGHKLHWHGVSIRDTRHSTIPATPGGKDTNVKSPGWLRAGLSIGSCAFALCAWASHARAQDFGNHLYDRFQVSASGSLLWFGSEVRIDAKDGSVGTDLSIEDDLGFSDTKFQPRLAVQWKPGRKHQLELGYQFARRSASRTLDQTIDVGDTSFAAGAQINSVFDTDNAFLNYRFAIVADERKQLGVGLGLGAFFFNVGLDALASVSGGGEGATVSYSNTTDFIAPTMALGLFGRFRSGDRWYIDPDVRYLRLTVDRLTAQVVEAGLVTRYYVSPKWGLEGGLGLKAVQIDVGPKTDGTGIVDLDASARIRYGESQVRFGVVFPL
jgi:hypothetical protein